MARLKLDITMSLDGYVAGPSPTLEEPLGQGGEGLHEWVTRLAAWREQHGLEGGETGPDNALVEETVGAVDAWVMGRRMFSGGEGPWEDDPNPDGWWGDEPPFHGPVFVLTSHAREPLIKSGGTTFTFVTDGIESALEQARAAADGGDVQLSGGASVVQQYARAGLIDDYQIHVVPLLLGGGTSLFGALGDQIALEQTRVVPSDVVTHLSFVPAS